MGTGLLTVRNSLQKLLKEAFEGPEKEEIYFTDPGPSAGLMNTIERINAREASMILSSSQASIAAHVHHTLYHLQVTNASLLEEDRQVDWSLSWKIREVDEGTWQAFKSQLKEEYENFSHTLDTIDWTEKQTVSASAAIAHCAYHLGSLKQLIAQLP
ncbi:hypothetical protein [Alteribacter natronophilus]|uniref:hypothetical protein n=1 Tax=Alteribacter natronophilus TaxID=2583810 RepID=UPI00110E82E6|nr:hypothetical protein [Alteribacter natronophilus]TMW70141.1 hypothetical protein FGB90_18420 [Alteribacter natronophilus]